MVAGGHDDFVERRKHRIGASDVAAALTGSFGSSPAAVIAGKLGLINDGPTDRMQLGLLLEDSVIDAAAALLQVDVIDRQVETQHPEWPWLVATVDAVVAARGTTFPVWPLEIKTTSNPGGYPEEYLEAQLAVQCACMSVPVGYSAVRNLSTWDLKVRKHYLDDDFLEVILRIAESLWGYLDSGVLPPAIFPADANLWNRLYPRSTTGSVELPSDLMAALVTAREVAKLNQNQAEALEAHVKELLGDCENGLVDGVPAVLWRTITSRRVDLKSMEADAPDLVEAHRVESTARRFTLIAPIKHTQKEANT